MGPGKHLIAGLAAGAILGVAARNPHAGAVLCATSVLVDVDHAAEYVDFCIRRRKKPAWEEFSSGSYFPEKGTIVVGLHGYEYAAATLAVLIVCLALWQPAALYVGAVLAGYVLHLVLDVVGNEIGIRGYSLIYRARVRFAEEILCGMSRSHTNGKQ